MTTLSKLGAKLEDLLERNKMLSDIIESKGLSSGVHKHSGGGHSVTSSHREVRLNRIGERGRDPDAVVKKAEENRLTYSGDRDTPNYAAPPILHDEPSVFSDMGSTIISYDEQPKKLEPESASVLGGIMEEEGLRRRNSRTSSGSREENSLLITDLDGASVEESSLSQSQLVKVKGGEYFGLLNARGQKHGVGKMTYDNGNEYEGQWKNNKRDGKGTTKYASGNVYTGKTVNHSLPSFDCIHHRVMLTTLNVILVTYQLSSSSSGSWKEGKRHGFGVFHIKKTGDIYSKTVNHSFASFLQLSRVMLTTLNMILVNSHLHYQGGIGRMV